MLLAILPPIQSCPVGQQHPGRLKVFFQSRPPKTKLLPEWDLEVVSEASQKEPFEPLSNIDIKFLSLKTVFLIAITFFHRCNDIRSLRIDQESMKIQKKRVFLL